ncbi:uncharacterized protein LAJ45_01046 [Morchella importuna]|uniref:Uncharacterized protein n=1 Tax=Morchella conica CCBAS932 TaxID=1392247 RepID=A0A3N4KNV7_9PEZI|nr:uncharacterized protein LAJ45_01046 [Morchella importuna]KAH8154518.1 hypothetical protein LAJ45_01046 [Morchella importuna]RPB12284.1 hypothetical protein P167DRAFT_574314 [Morchella conica CCBAS932]
MYPFCGHPYKEVAPKYARNADTNYGNGVCRRYNIAFCERAKEGMSGPCVTYNNDETEYRCALMELPDTVVKVDYNDCDLESSKFEMFPEAVVALRAAWLIVWGSIDSLGCKAGTPKRETDRFGRPATRTISGGIFTGPNRRVQRGYEDKQYRYDKSWERNT